MLFFHLTRCVYNVFLHVQVIGSASLQTRCGVFSFFRLDPTYLNASTKSEETAPRSKAEQASLLFEASHTLLHELCHTLNMQHCTYYECLLNGSTDSAVVGEVLASDKNTHHLCPVRILTIPTGHNHRSVF